MKTRWLLALVALAAIGCQTAAQSVSDQPDTPFKLATFDTGGDAMVGLVLGDRILDISGASEHLVAEAQASAIELPGEMRALIEFGTCSTAAVMIEIASSKARANARYRPAVRCWTGLPDARQSCLRISIVAGSGRCPRGARLTMSSTAAQASNARPNSPISLRPKEGGATRLPSRTARAYPVSCWIG